MSTVEKQPRQVKVYTKLSKFIEETSIYRNSRQELRDLLSQVKALPDNGVSVLKVDSDQATLDIEGKPILKKVTKTVKEFTTEESKSLHAQIKSKRQQILRLNKKASMFLIKVTQQIVRDFVTSCENEDCSGKNLDKAIGWKSFNHSKFENTITGSLVRGCPSYCTLLDIKKTLRTLQYEKDIAKKNNNTIGKGSIMQDIQKYRQLIKETARDLQRRSDEFLKMEIAYGEYQNKFTVVKKQYDADKQQIYTQIQALDQIVDAEQIEQLQEKLKSLYLEFKQHKKDESKQERTILQNKLLRQAQQNFLENNTSDFSQEQVKTLTSIYNSIQYLQNESPESKKFLNHVKQTLKNLFKKNQDTEKTQKATNGFKYFISRVVQEFLVGLTKRIEVYVGSQRIKNVKDQDLVKIFKIWSNGENQPEIFNALNDMNSDLLSNDVIVEESVTAE